jgi:cell division protein FtsB
MTIQYTEDEVRLIIDRTRLEEAKKHEAVVATLEQENRQLRARNERLEAERNA